MMSGLLEQDSSFVHVFKTALGDFVLCIEYLKKMIEEMYYSIAGNDFSIEYTDTVMFFILYSHISEYSVSCCIALN